MALIDAACIDTEAAIRTSCSFTTSGNSAPGTRRGSSTRLSQTAKARRKPSCSGVLSQARSASSTFQYPPCWGIADYRAAAGKLMVFENGRAQLATRTELLRWLVSAPCGDRHTGPAGCKQELDPPHAAEPSGLA